MHMPHSQSARYLQVLSSYKDSKYQSTFAVIAHVGCMPTNGPLDSANAPKFAVIA